MLKRIYYYGLVALGAASAVALPILALLTGRWDSSVLLVELLPLSFFVVGVLAFAKRPTHPAVQRLLAVGALHLLAFALAALTAVLPAWLSGRWILNLFSSLCFSLGFVALLDLFAVFPNGAYQHHYERGIVRAFTLAAILLPVLHLVASPTQNIVLYLETPVPATSSPLFIPALAPLANLYPIIVISPLVGLVLLLLRYRRASVEQRVQMRWPLTSAALLGVALITTGVIENMLGATAQTVIFILVAATLPATLVIGILRHRLFDIDLIIRKSLVYAVLWLAIAVAYGIVTAALGIAASQRLPVSLAVVLTIIAAMLFQPARQRLEYLADRLVFGERLGGYDLIRQFGATLEHAFDLQELGPKVAATVRRGLDARWARVSLYRTVQGNTIAHPIAADGIGLHEHAEGAIAVPLIHAGEQVGIVECGPKREGKYTQADHDLLATLAQHAALAIRNVRLATDLAERVAELHARTEELAASRTRIVQAAEVERRRIERDIHDGIQQQIVALLARLALIRAQLANDRMCVEDALADLQGAVHQIHTDLREWVRGIHPAVLSDRGLEEAIAARVARLPIEVTIVSDGTMRGVRYAQEIEGAAYFLISEALTNVMKHAATDQITVRLDVDGDYLRVEVKDMGRGFDPCHVQSSGLRGLQDRLEALGGSVEVHAQPGSGTCVIGMLPIRERQHA